MTRHLLDSDSVIDALNGVGETLALLQQLTQQENTLCTCDVVIAEVYTGLTPQERGRAEAFLSALEFLPTSADAARQAGEWRYDFARRGTALATTDCLIAAVALEHQATLVTGNVRHFPMPDLSTLPLPRGGGRP